MVQNRQTRIFCAYPGPDMGHHQRSHAAHCGGAHLHRLANPEEEEEGRKVG
jgi:hypothetical protein